MAGFLRLFNSRKGQGLVEYALIILLVVLAVVGAVTSMGEQVATMYNTILGGLPW
jgi:Flp pilus assembly pilin Flp